MEPDEFQKRNPKEEQDGCGGNGQQPPECSDPEALPRGQGFFYRNLPVAIYGHGIALDEDTVTPSVSIKETVFIFLNENRVALT